MFLDTYEKYDGGDSVVVLGKFDGVHIGHKKLFDIAKQYAKGRNVIAFTFCSDKCSLTTSNEKKMLLYDAGANVVIEQNVSDGFFDMSAKDFLSEVLIKRLNVSVIVCGNDFYFGKNRGGDVAFLKNNADKYAYEIFVVADEKYNNQIVKSSLIRKELSIGNMEDVNGMLGYEYSITGNVTSGNKLGRKYAYPTANIYAKENKLVPPHGVYATKVIIDNRCYYGMTNVGVKPTINTNGVENIETYIFDFDEDIYGKDIEVRFVKYFRPEKTFSGIDELFEQISNDAMAIRGYFNLN